MTRALFGSALVLTVGFFLWGSQSAAMTACLKAHSADTCVSTLNR